jgi:hypothetical protein
MRVAQATTERLVLRGSSPLFKPFFLGGLGWMALGVAILAWALAAGRPLHAALPGDESSTPIGGLGAFLVPFGFFLALVSYLGALPYRKEVVVDRVAGHLIRRDWTLRGLREDRIAAAEIQGVGVEETRHVDGDPDYTAALRLGTGKSVVLDRFPDRGAAEHIAQLVRGYLGSL